MIPKLLWYTLLLIQPTLNYNKYYCAYSKTYITNKLQTYNMESSFQETLEQNSDSIPMEEDFNNVLNEIDLIECEDIKQTII